MKILALEKELADVPAEKFLPLLQEEAECAWEMQQAGVLREIYFDADHHTAVMMLECNDVEDARKALATLPLVRSNLIKFEVIPLVPYDGFARLFGED